MKSTVTLSELITLRKCGQAYQFEQLNFLRLHEERYLFLKKAIRELKQLLMQKKEVYYFIEYLDSQYSADWFDSNTTYIVSKQRDYGLLTRLYNYLYSLEGDIININISYEIALKEEISHNNQLIDLVKDYVDIIVKKNESYEAIKILLTEPSYSYRAKLQQNKVENSLELLSMYIGLKNLYKNLTVSIYYLKNKKDTPNELQAYENKPGNNIITSTFQSDVSINSYVNVINLLDCNDCKSCKYMPLCFYKPTIREPIPVEKKENEHTVNIITNYTDAQIKVINHVNGPMNVIAVPGAGKTKSLVARMVNLIENHSIQADNILFLTFTNKACEEIKERVALAMPNKLDLPHIYTFHGLGYQILLENKSLIGNIRLADTIDRLKLIYSTLSLMPPIRGVSYEGLYMSYGLINQCDKWFKQIDQHGVETFTSKYSSLDVNNIINCYNYFSREFKKEFISYDQQIELCNQLFRYHPDILKMYSKQYKYIMVDEYQDVDSSQVQFVYSLASQHRNLVVVGDDDQSVYKFRGGSNKHLFNFSKVFPKSVTMIMSDNFRSLDTILHASEALIKKNTRFDKEFIAHNLGGSKPLLMPHSSPEYILSFMQKNSSKIDLGDTAIISRNNSTLIKVSEVISKSFQCTSPKDYLIDDTIFLLIYDLLQLYFSSCQDDISLYRLSLFDNVNKYLVKTNKDISFYENLIINKQVNAIDVNKLFSEYKVLKENALNSFILKILKTFKVIQFSTNISSCIFDMVSIWTDITEVHPVIDKLNKSIREKSLHTLYKFFTFISDLIKYNDKIRIDYPKQKDCIALLTAHDSKGKEYSCVLLILDDFSTDFKSIEDEEEERRLLFVAMTRAKKNLIILQNGKQMKFLQDFIEHVIKIA